MKSQLKSLLLLTLLISGCAGTWRESYPVLDMRCESVVSKPGKIPVIDPVQAYTACEDKKGNISYPTGVPPGDVVTAVAGGAKGLVSGAATIGSMTGGF